MATLAALLGHVGCAVVYVTDGTHEQFVAGIGHDRNLAARAVPFCRHVATSPDLVEMTDPDDEIFSDNGSAGNGPKICALSGLPLRVESGEAIGSLVLVSTEKAVLSNAQRVSLKEIARQMLRYVAVAASRHRDDGEHKRLRREEMVSRWIIDVAGDAIISAALDGTVLSFNPAAERLLGFSASDVVGHATFESFVDRSELARATEQASMSQRRHVSGFEALTFPVVRESVARQEWTFIRSDGSRVPVHLTFSVRRDDQGTPVGFVAVARDLSEVRALRSETAINRAIVAHAGVAIIATELDGTITAFNPAAEQLLGYSESEMVGHRSPAVFHDPVEVKERGDQLSRQYGETIEGFATFVRPLRDQPFHTEVWTYVRKDGERLPVMLTVSTLRDERGDAVGYLGVARDQSEHFRQVAREKSLAEIADIVRECQERFISAGSADDVFEKLLSRMLAFTGSEYGFVGEVKRDPLGLPFLHTRALTDISWSPETRALYDLNKERGFEFRNLHTLFGVAMTTGVAVISNDPTHDPRRGGLPDGHPPMDSFVGLPCYYGGELVGLIGLANRLGGYDRDFVTQLDTLLTSTGSLIQATRLDEQRRASAATLADKEHRLRLILATAADMFIEVGQDGILREWNQRAEAMVGRSRTEAIGRPIDEVLQLRLPDGEYFSIVDSVGGGGWIPEKPREVEVTLTKGDSFPAELVAWRVPSDDGAGICAFLRSIGDRKQMEDQQRRLFESETLLKEVHHRIKNNMQVISSLLSIQSSKIGGVAERAVFLDCRERIRAMSLIHEKLYSTGSYGDIDFADYLREMVSLLVSSNRPEGCDITPAVDAAVIRMPVDRAVPLSLIASELVLNSLKHGFHGRNAGVLAVRLTQHGDTCELFVGDDGPGPSSIDSSEKGVGMELIGSLVRQIRGTLAIGAYDSTKGIMIRWSV